MELEQPDFEWYDNTLRVDDNGHVVGQAWYGSFADGHDVTISVTSYDYDRYGETKTNHVPHVVVTDKNGNIVAEPHAHDSSLPKKAIKEAKQTGKYVIENPEQFIE